MLCVLTVLYEYKIIPCLNMNVDLKTLALVHMRSGKISQEEIDAINPLVCDYIRTLTECQSPRDFQNTASALRHLEKVYGLLRKDARGQAGHLFAQRDALKLTYTFLKRLQSYSEIELSPTERDELLTIKARLYDLLLNANNLLRGESEISDKLVDEGVCRLMFQDLVKYQPVYLNEPKIKKVVNNGMGAINNISNKRDTLRNRTLEQQAGDTLNAYTDPDTNDPEMVFIAVRLQNRLNDSKLRLHAYPANFFITWITMVTRATYKDAKEGYFVEFPSPSSKSTSLGGMVDFFNIISTYSPNQCLMIDHLEMHVASLNQFMKRGSEIEEFTDFMHDLWVHSRTCPNPSCSSSSYLANFLMRHNVNTGAVIDSINVDDNTALLWVAKRIKDRTTCFDLGVRLHLNPDETWDLIRKYKEDELMVATMTIVSRWRDATKSQSESERKRQLTAALTEVLQEIGDSDCKSTRRSVHSGENPNTGETPGGKTLKKLLEESSVADALLKRVTEIRSSSEFRLKGKTEEEELEIAIRRSLHPAETLTHRDDVIPDSALASVASSLKAQCCKRFAVEELGLKQSTVDEIEESHLRRGYETNKGILLKWKNDEGNAATFATLMTALHKFNPDLDAVGSAVSALQQADKKLERQLSKGAAGREKPIATFSAPDIENYIRSNVMPPFQQRVLNLEDMCDDMSEMGSSACSSADLTDDAGLLLQRPQAPAILHVVGNFNADTVTQESGFGSDHSRVDVGLLESSSNQCDEDQHNVDLPVDNLQVEIQSSHQSISHMELTESPAAAATGTLGKVLLLLCEWNVTNKSPLHSTMKRLLQEMKIIRDIPVSVVLGQTKYEMDRASIEELENLNVNIIEPRVVDTTTPQERVSDECEECYKHVLLQLPEFSYMIAVTYSTSNLAQYLKQNQKHSDRCKLIMMNLDEQPTEENSDFHAIDVFRSAALIFSVGKAMCQKWRSLIDDQAPTLSRRHKTLLSNIDDLTALGDTDKVTEWEAFFTELHNVPENLDAVNLSKDDFEVDKGKESLIGQGKYSAVRDGRLRGEPVAIKYISFGGMKHINPGEVLREVNVMNKLNCPHINIIKILGSCIDDDHAYILMEKALYTMETFFEMDAYKELDLTMKVRVSSQLCDGLSFLHNNFIVHQDIKPSNILFGDELTPKLADFGTARVKTRMERETTFSSSDMSEKPGTPYYQAPEVQCECIPAQPSSDVWTLCLVFVKWFTGLEPWKGKLTQAQLMRLKDKGKMPDRIESVDGSVKGIIEAGLNYDRYMRPTASQLKERFDSCL